MKPKETFVYITLHIPTDIPTYTHKYVCVCACVCIYVKDFFVTIANFLSIQQFSFLLKQRTIIEFLFI